MCTLMAYYNMGQSDYGRARLTLTVLFINLRLATGKSRACKTFCDEKRPPGTSDGFKVTCKDVVEKGNWDDMSLCTSTCTSCPKICSKGKFNCPSTGMQTYIVILVCSAIILFFILLVVGIFFYLRHRRKHRVGDSGTQPQPDGEERASQQKPHAEEMDSASVTESEVSTSSSTVSQL